MSASLCKTLPILSLALVIGILLPHGQGMCETPGLEKINKPIKKHESELERLQGGIRIHLGKLQVIARQEFSLLEEIERLDKNLALQKIRLDVMVERLNSQEDLLVTKKQALEFAQHQMEKVKVHLQKRLRSYYLIGKTGILNVTFSTRTLPDLMLFNDSFKTLLDYDRALFNKYRNTIDLLTQARDNHEKESILLNEYIATAVKQQQELDALLEEKRVLLRKVKTQKVLQEQAVMELKKAETDLRTTLARLKKKKSYTLKGFVLNKGKMKPPVKGRVLTRFGEGKNGTSPGEGQSSGITFDAANGAQIQAIFAGRIIYAGYKKGYGNMVIIDHGMNYYSIVARMEKISVKEGQAVGAGDTIGVAGDIATLFEKGVYFEIRHDTQPVDPLEWISLAHQ